MLEEKNVNAKVRSAKAQAAIEAWLRPVPWQLFAHLTFPWKAREETAVAVLMQWVNLVEKHTKTRLGMVYSGEARSKQGWSVPFHFHAALTALRPLDTEFMRKTWKRLVGRANAQGVHDDTILLKPYDAAKEGLEYIVKMGNEQDSTWDTSSIEFFQPHIKRTANMGRRPGYKMARWGKEQAKFGTPSKP